VLVRQPSFATIGQDAAELSRLFVSPAARRQGVAQALVETTMRWAAANDRSLALEVTDHLDAARALYERTGFRQVDTRRASWTAPDGEPVTLHEYTWNPAG
jgi:ribosomal protein S18 acetylase RimI-like enzyme